MDRIGFHFINPSMNKSVFQRRSKFEVFEELTICKTSKEINICTEFLFLALYFLKITLLSANQNEEIFSCILLQLLLMSVLGINASSKILINTILSISSLC